MLAHLSSQADRLGGRDGLVPVRGDVSSMLPLYLQLATYLRALIKTLQLQPGDCIPSEPELARRFGVSRATVRQAVDVLFAAGMVRRIQGKGTLLTERVIQPPPTLLLGTVEDYLYRGEVLTTAVLRTGEVAAPERVAAFFGRRRRAPVFRIARRRSRAQEDVVSYVLSYLRPTDGKRIETSWLATESLLRILAIRLGIPLGIIQQRVEAESAPRAVAGQLKARAGAAILKIETRVWTRAKEPVDFVETYLQPGYRYLMEYEWAGIVPGGCDSAVPIGRRKRGGRRG